MDNTNAHLYNTLCSVLTDIQVTQLKQHAKGGKKLINQIKKVQSKSNSYNINTNSGSSLLGHNEEKSEETPRSRVILEKSTVTQAVKEFTAFEGT